MCRPAGHLPVKDFLDYMSTLSKNSSLSTNSNKKQVRRNITKSISSHLTGKPADIKPIVQQMEMGIDGVKQTMKVICVLNISEME